MLALFFVGCDAAPRGEALLVVDTDMPIPKIVDHLRVDVYSSDGSKWWVSRDIYLPDPASWPASFSVYSDDTSAPSSALVRLRAYRSGYVQDYHGEGRLDLPALGTSWNASDAVKCCSADCTSLCPTYWQPTADCDNACPRLFDTTQSPPLDVTPTTEPQPLVTIDRLVHVDLVPGSRGKVRVLLAGACAGTQAILPDPSRANASPDDIETCVDTERTVVPVAPATLDPDMTLPPPGSSVQGAFEAPFATDCSSPPRTPTPGLFDDEVCVRGGVMIFGDNTGATRAALAAQPRIAAVPSFLMDKYEYSVARVEDAFAHKLSLTSLSINNASANDPNAPIGGANCTAYSDPSWASPERDAEALNCVRPGVARLLCQARGGDLPTEAQWEYAASAAGRATKDFITYPVANALSPSCADVSYGRSTQSGLWDCYKTDPKLFGVARVDYGNDVADAIDGGLVGMTGNVTEDVLDAAVAMVANCWLSAPIASPACLVDSADGVVTRGGAWLDARADVTTAFRLVALRSAGYADHGFRCVR